MARFASVCAVFLLGASSLLSESKNPAEYPLRLHIFSRNETDFLHNRMTEEVKGEGRADLYQGGEAHAVDFSYDCSQRLRASFSFETYPAKWRKPGKELTVLLPVFGQTGSFFTCNLKTDVKDSTYYQYNGRLLSEPVSEFKSWMAKHDYDPEHGKNTPAQMEPGRLRPTSKEPGSKPETAAPEPPQ